MNIRKKLRKGKIKRQERKKDKKQRKEGRWKEKYFMHLKIF